MFNRPQADTEAASPESSIAVADVCAPGDVCIYTAQHTAATATCYKAQRSATPASSANASGALQI